MKGPLRSGRGLRYWGPNLVRNFRKISNCTVRAICDVNLERLAHLQSLYPDVETVTDFERFSGKRTDAVAIATPSTILLAREGKSPRRQAHLHRETDGLFSAECEELMKCQAKAPDPDGGSHVPLLIPVKKIVDLVRPETSARSVT